MSVWEEHIAPDDREAKLPTRARDKLDALRRELVLEGMSPFLVEPRAANVVHIQMRGR